MTLSDVAIRRPVFTAMLSLTLLVLGFLGYSRLGTDLYPNATIPFCQVTTVYPGASPADVEGLITRPIEDAAASIPGIDRIFSQSRENASIVFVQFKMAVPFSEAVQQVRDKVGVAQFALPQGAYPPVITQFDIASQPIIVFSASSNADALSLYDVLNEKVRPRLEQVEGVAAARVVGGSQREVLVELDPARVKAMGIAPEMVVQRIRAENIDLPAGRYEDGPHEVTIRMAAAFKDADALRRMLLGVSPTGQQITLADVAKVHEGAAESRTLVRTNGRQAQAMEIIKQSGTNTVEVAKRVKAQLETLHEELGDNFHADMIIDQSKDIEANAHEVWIAIYFGGAMAILIILVFLMDWRGTLISALALPTSVVGTLFIMWLLGFTLNQLTLLALSLAIGLLIDDAVVVRESITKRLEAGENPVRAASLGTQEIALAVMATTFTLCAVFVPVAFMQGVVGQFFRQFGLTIAASVLISLFVALTLDPMLSARFVRRHHGTENPLKKALQRFFQGVDALYAKSLNGVLAHRALTMVAAVAIFAGSIGIGMLLGSDFLGAEDRGQLIVTLDFPPGTRLATAAERSAVAEAEVLKLPGVNSVYAVVGLQEQVEKAMWRVSMVSKSERTRTMDNYKDDIRTILGRVNEARFTVAETPLMEGVGEWPPILMRITGPDLQVLQKEAAFLAKTLKDLPGTTDVQLKDSPGKPELHMTGGKDIAASLLLPAAVVGTQVRLATLGEVAGKLRTGAREADIRVRMAPEARATREAIEKLPIYSQRGLMALGDVARFALADGPAVIEHERRERQISVTANLANGADLGTVTQALHKVLDDHKLDPGYTYMFSGQQKEMNEMKNSIKLALGLAVVFIFMVLASQFESLVHPFTIMLSLPLALVGAVLGLAVGGYNLAIGANIGLILLMGLVTKNAILLVDGALQRIRAGDTPLEAMRHAGPRRLRPILMTSAAMVLGMLPTALGRGTGSEFRAPMAVAVIGGVITSTLLTLWVVPAVFVAFENLRGDRPRQNEL